MKNKEVKSHTIQNAIIKRWIENERISYVLYNTKEGGFFDPYGYKEFNPFVITGHFSEKTENGINTLEVEGDRVVKKILKMEDNVILTRAQIITMKFYLLLSSARTNLVRKNIENLNCSGLFKKQIKKSDKTPKENQEIIMEILSKEYNSYKENVFSYFKKLESEIGGTIFNNNFDVNKIYDANEIHDDILKKLNPELIEKVKIYGAIKSEIIFVKFLEGELLLTEANDFNIPIIGEHMGLKYSFYPISPTLGVLLISPIDKKKSFDQLKKENNLFSFDLDEFPEIQYMKEKQISEFFGENFKNIPYINNKIKYNVEENFETSKDKFTYKIHFENEETSIICNGMALSYCDDSYVIYKSIHNYYKAVKWIENKLLEQKKFKK